MIEKNHPSLSVVAQCRLLSISQSSFNYEPQGETAMNLDLMLMIEKQFLDTPFYGVRQMTWHLQNEGHVVNQKRFRRLMRLMRLMPIYQKPDTSRPAKGHKTYPYLLGGLRVERPNQVWCADITYLPMCRGFLYLVAVMDWFTRKVLAWRISNTLEADFCVEALNEAIHKLGPPEIMNMEHCRATGSSGHATSGQPVHVLRLDRPPEADRRPNLDGRQGPLPRQHLHQTSVAVPEI
ncbi:MAG: DDE-type integrase/transposase/recombinase [Rhizobiaceae bacterium]